MVGLGGAGLFVLGLNLALDGGVAGHMRGLAAAAYGLCATKPIVFHRTRFFAFRLLSHAINSRI